MAESLLLALIVLIAVFLGLMMNHFGLLKIPFSNPVVCADI